MPPATDPTAPDDGPIFSSGSVVVMSSIPEWAQMAEPPPERSPETPSEQVSQSPRQETPPASEQPLQPHQSVAPDQAEQAQQEQQEQREQGKSAETQAIASDQHHSSAASEFAPVWEIDRVNWPKDCEQLYHSQADYFHHAGEKLREASEQGLRVLAVASNRPGEGCTTLAMCLARAVAAAGSRVAILDADVERPELCEKLGLEFSRGWQDVVSGELPLPEVAVASISDRITLIPSSHGDQPLDPARVSRVLHEATQAVDLVILDTGRLKLREGDLFENGESSPINAAIIVRDLRVTSETKTLDTAAGIRRMGVEAIGVAENFVPRGSHRSAA